MHYTKKKIYQPRFNEFRVHFREKTFYVFKIEKGFNRVTFKQPSRPAPALSSEGPAAKLRGGSHRLEQKKERKKERKKPRSRRA